MRALVLEHVEVNPATLYREVLDARRIAVDVVRLDLGEQLPPWRDYDLVVVMGGPMSAFDEAGYPWLADEKNLIREVVAAGVPYFGVCLGAQLLAEALGGRTYHGPEPELGIHPVVLTEAGGVDPVFGGFPRHISVFEFHEDTFDLPPRAVRLAGSSRFPNQAFRVGPVAYGSSATSRSHRPSCRGASSCFRPSPL